MIEVTPDSYIIDGRPFIRVSSLIKKFGLLPDYNSNGNALEFGANVHLTCEYFDKGILKESTLDPALVPYLKAWQIFMHEWIIKKWDNIEMTVISKLFGFAGTLDRDYDGKIYDIKTGKPSKWHGVQLALYKLAYEEMTGFKIRDTYCVYLEPAKYAIKKYDKKTDRSAAMALLTLNNWNKK